MGTLTDYVTISITQNSVGITRAGFGVPLILSATAAWVERIRFYSDIAGVLADFPVTTSAEYLAAQAVFSQSPGLNQIAIGRSALKPTLVATLTAVNPTTNILYTYTATVRGKGFTDTVVSYVSTGSPTDALYAAGMVTALNAIAGKNFTAAGAVSPVTVTATTPGDWFSIEVGDVATQKVKLTHVDPGVATDLAAIQLANSGWYALLTMYNSKPYSIAAAAWVEANGKVYLCESCDSESVLTSIGNAELLDTIATNAYARTLGAYHPSPANMLAVALAGKCLPYDPGSVTFFGKTLAGVAPVILTATHRANLVARRATSYETVAGLNITFGGQVGDPITGYLDVRRDLDSLQDDMSKGVFGILAGNPKVAYTDAGIAAVESEVRAALKRATDAGILAAVPSYTVTVPKAATVSTANKAARLLPNVKFSATLAGAIHKVALVGTVSL